MATTYDDLLKRLRQQHSAAGGRLDINQISAEDKVQLRELALQRQQAGMAAEQKQKARLQRSSAKTPTGGKYKDFDTGRFSGTPETITQDRIAAARNQTNSTFADPKPKPGPVGGNYQQSSTLRDRAPSITSQIDEPKPALRERVAGYMNRNKPAPEQPRLPEANWHDPNVQKGETFDMNAQQRSEYGTASKMEQEALQRKQRLSKDLASAQSAANPNADRIAGLRAELDRASADHTAARQLQDEVKAQPRGKSTFDEIKANPKSAPKAVEQVAKDTVSQIKEEAPKIATKVKNGTATVGERTKHLAGKVVNKMKSLRGGDAKADASIEAEVSKKMPPDMDPQTKKKLAAKFRISASTIAAVPALYDMYGQFSDRAEEVGVAPAMGEFADSIIESVKGLGSDIADVENPADALHLAGDIAWGMVAGFAAGTSNGVKRMSNSLYEAFGGTGPGRFNVDDPWDWTPFVDPSKYGPRTVYNGYGDAKEVGTPKGMMAMSTVQPSLRNGVIAPGGGGPVGYSAPPQAPSGFQGAQPLPITRSPEAAPPAPPPPMLGAGDQSLPAAYQDPQISLSQQGDTGRFTINGKNGGIGVMDATNATGGPSGFRDRVNESMKAGAYNPVSDARRQQGLRDLEQVRKGTDAIRELSASRLGVPVEYLDAVRAGQLSRRDAALLGARDGGLRSRYGDTPAEMMKAQAAMQEANAKAQDSRTGQIEAGQTFMQNAGQNLATQAFPNDPEKQAQYGARFQNFAESKLPKGTPFHLLEAPQQAEIMGEFALADYLSRKGEGWLRSLNPLAPDITAEAMAGTGQSILETMMQQGTMFDIGDDNKVFAVRDSSGRPVTVRGEMEDMPPAAQNYIEQFISRMSPEERARRGGLRGQ